MSKSLAELLLAHLKGEVTTLCLCWVIKKKDAAGTKIFGTDHDLNVKITTGDLAGTYIAGANVTGSDVASSSDMSVDNTEVDGSFTDTILIPDLTVEDVRGGLFNSAPVTLFFTNWQSPDDGQCYMRSGFLGALTWDSSGVYKTELRGLTQLLSQIVVDSYSVECGVKKFGDARCKVDVPAITVNVDVTDVTSRRQFTVAPSGSPSALGPVGMFNTGTLLGLTGANAGFTRQIKNDNVSSVHGQVLLFDPFPNDVALTDTFAMAPGCDRSMTACKFYGSVPNYRGYGIFIPGVDAMLLGPVGSGPTAGGGA